MADQGGGGERTEKATPKKRRDARERGQVRKSADLVAALTMMIMAAVLQLVISNMGTSLMDITGKYIANSHSPAESLSLAGAGKLMNMMVTDFLSVMLILLGVAFIAGIVANVVQFGFLFSTKAMGIKMGKLNPLKGLKRIISFQTLFDLAKNIVKIIVIGIIIYGEISANTEKFLDDNFSGTPDLRLAANGIDFMRMMMREEDPDTLFFNRKLQIEGDTELGLITKNLLDSVEWPFSEWFLKRSTSTLD